MASSKGGGREEEAAHIKRNLDLFKRVVASAAFAPHLKHLLRFVTACPSIIDRSMRVKLQFVRGQPTSAVPRAHTCFQTLDLSCEPYESEQQLAALLETCARNSTAFGMR